MPGDKYLRNNAGTLAEVEARQSSAGSADAGRIPALDPGGRFDVSMMPTGIGADTVQITASEALGAGDLVNVWNSGGSPRVRKADASATGKDAHGFVTAAVALGAAATVFFEGNNQQVAGLSAGVQFLSATTAGAATSVAPSGAGQVVQRVGVATSATSLNFEMSQPVVLA